MAQPVITITNLKEFRVACREAADANVREVTRALKVAGKPLDERAPQLAPKATGTMAGTHKLTVSGTNAYESFTGPQVMGAEFGQGLKWQGRWVESYGQPPRFGYKALDEKADEIVEILDTELKSIQTLHGWAT